MKDETGHLAAMSLLVPSRSFLEQSGGEISLPLARI